MAKWLEKQYQTSPLGAVVENSMTSGSVVNAPSVSAVQKAISNPNLLVNGDFRNPINQRGLTSYWKPSSWTYNVDRWTHLWNSVILNDGYIKVYNDTGETGTTYFKQIFEHSLGQADYTITVSVKEITGTVQVNGFGNLKKGINAFTVKNTSLPQMQLNLVGESSIELYWIKLEQGEIATPFVPRLIGEELALCKRYYQKAFITIPVLNNQGGYYEFPIEMRSAPTTTYDAISFGVAGTALQTSFNGSTVYESSRTKDRIIFAQNFRDGVVALRCLVYCDAEIY